MKTKTLLMCILSVFLMGMVCGGILLVLVDRAYLKLTAQPERVILNAYAEYNVKRDAIVVSKEIFNLTRIERDSIVRDAGIKLNNYKHEVQTANRKVHLRGFHRISQ